MTTVPALTGKYKDPPFDADGFGFPGAEDMGNMFQFKRDFETEYCGSRDLVLSRTLNPSLLTFKEWLSQNKDLIPIE